MNENGFGQELRDRALDDSCVKLDDDVQFVRFNDTSFEMISIILINMADDLECQLHKIPFPVFSVLSV